jgi:hypothetical protein
VKYHINLNRTQKSFNLKRQQEAFHAALQQIQGFPEKFSEQEEKLMQHLLEIHAKCSQLRSEEVHLFHDQSEEFYLTQEFESALILNGFAKMLAENSGLDDLSHILLLERKISRSLNTLDIHAKLRLESPSKLPPITIQIRFAKLDALWEECSTEKERTDAIHPAVVEKIHQTHQEVKKYMSAYGITILDPVESRHSSLWNSTKARLNLKSKDLRFNYYVSTAKKTESLPLAKAKMQKAYRLMQESPGNFSLETQRFLINQIAEIDKKIEGMSNQSQQILSESLDQMNDFEFEPALSLLRHYAEELTKGGLEDELDQVLEQIKICTVNQQVFLDFHAIERIHAQHDLLGSKTAIIQFRDRLQTIEEYDLLLDSLLLRIDTFQQSLSNGGNNTYISHEDFDPFGDTDIPRETTQVHVPAGENNLFPLFSKKLRTVKQISKEDLATFLGLPIEELFEKLILWKNSLNFSLQSGQIRLIEASSSVSQKEQNHRITPKKTTKKKSTKKKSTRKKSTKKKSTKKKTTKKKSTKKASRKGSTKQSNKKSTPKLLVDKEQKELDALEALDQLLQEDFD